MLFKEDKVLCKIRNFFIALTIIDTVILIVLVILDLKEKLPNLISNNLFLVFISDVVLLIVAFSFHGMIVNRFLQSIDDYSTGLEYSLKDKRDYSKQVRPFSKRRKQ